MTSLNKTFMKNNNIRFFINIDYEKNPLCINEKSSFKKI